MSDCWVRDVYEFHAKFCPDLLGDRPAVPESGGAELRYRLILEELEEMRAAMAAGDLAGVADGGVDLIYVVLGALLSWGIDPRPVFDAIHAANMAKVGGGRRADGKIPKPPGWEPPDIAAILAHQPPLPALLGPAGDAGAETRTVRDAT